MLGVGVSALLSLQEKLVRIIKKERNFNLCMILGFGYINIYEDIGVSGIKVQLPLKNIEISK